MYIKHAFDSLSIIGKRKYFQKNEEEELYFKNSNITVNIYKIGTHIGINLNTRDKVENYMNSSLLSLDEKQSINACLNAYVLTPVDCNKISEILLQAFERHSMIINHKQNE